MRIVEVATWVAAGLAVITVVLAAWQLRKAHQRAQKAEQYANRIHVMATEAESQAARAEREAQHASSQARWAWEQVKLAANQLEQAQSEHRASAEAEHWEWSYALTTSAREAVDASNELIRIALDSHVAPHYRLAAERHYAQTSTRWYETMTKALARTEPTLELQQQVLTFTQVQHRLHGYLGVVLRAAETGTLAAGDLLTRQVLAAGQELENVRRQLQRTVSATLVGAHLNGSDPALPGQATQRVQELEDGPVTELTQRPDTARSETTQLTAAAQHAGHQQATQQQQVRGSLGTSTPVPEQGRTASTSRRDLVRASAAHSAAAQAKAQAAAQADPRANAQTGHQVNGQVNGRDATQVRSAGAQPPVPTPAGPAPVSPQQRAGRRGR
jgi:hypothetical protein